MAQEITRLRGRDPEIGSKLRENESAQGPLNKGKYVPPPEDVLATLLSNPRQFLHEPGVYDVVSLLEMIRGAEPGRKLPLLQQLGASTVIPPGVGAVLFTAVF